MPYIKIRHRDNRPYALAWAALFVALGLALCASGCKTVRSGSGGPDVSPSNPDRVWP